MSEEIKVGRRTVKITNPDKVLFPEDGFTKRDLIDYYEGISEVMLPHVKDRLMTLERFPDGIDGERFYSKNVPKYFPDWIDRETVPKKGGTTTMVVVTERATLVYLGNQAAITTHTSMHRVDKLGYPDQLMLDLDPSVDDFDEVRRIAKDVRGILDELGLASFVKTSGSRGLHVVAPLDRRSDVETVRLFARDVAVLAAKRDPDRVTIEGTKVDRKDRLYMDWVRNSHGQHAVAPYGVRARPGAPVAMPLDWDEVNDKKLHPQKWSIKTGLKRALSEPDPWAGWRKQARGLKEPRKKLDALLAEVEKS
jgi:bifunctional non-homologous end joining protein LigD